MLLLHGRDDDICPLSQSYPAYNSLKTRKVPTGLIVYPGEGHVRKPQSQDPFTSQNTCHLFSRIHDSLLLHSHAADLHNLMIPYTHARTHARTRTNERGLINLGTKATACEEPLLGFRPFCLYKRSYIRVCARLANEKVVWGGGEKDCLI